MADTAMGPEDCTDIRVWETVGGTVPGTVQVTASQVASEVVWWLVALVVAGVESETDYAVVTTVVGQFDYRTFSQTVRLTVSQVVTAVVT